MRERLKAEPNKTVREYLTFPEIIAESKRNFYNLSDINAAHVLMLAKQGIINKKDCKALLKIIKDLKAKGVNEITLDPAKEDFYFNVEAYIIDKAGIETGGKMHTARSRNDILTTMARLNARDAVLPLYPKVLELRRLLLELASKNIQTIATGYTHMQPAQPISMAYYFLAVSQAVERDFARLLSAYSRLNMSTLGSCAFAGTSFNIDRDYAAQLLGCDSPLDNSMDAIASRDYMLEYVSSFAILASTISRLAADLYHWSTDEFRLVEVDDSIAICSSIMPQKKNPFTLEHMRAKCSHFAGAYTSILMTLKGTAYGHNCDIADETPHLFWDAANEMNVLLELSNVTLSNIKIKKENAKARADRNFSTVTELADAIVKEERLSFREAHEIVGHIAGVCAEKGLSALDISPKMLDDASMIYIKRKLGWDSGHIRRVLDSKSSVEGKISFGGPSPAECGRMLKKQKAALKKDRTLFEKTENTLKSRKQRLDDEINAFIK